MNVIISNKYKDMLSTLTIDVIKSINGEYEADELIAMFSNFFFQRMILDITAIKNYKDIKNLQKISISLDMNKVILLLDDSADSSSSTYLSQLISMGIYNFTRNKEGIEYLLAHPNTYRDVAHIHQLNELREAVVDKVKNSVRVIGIRNLTSNAGATSLVYMLKKQLEQTYAVLGIEIGKQDFGYFNDKDMISTTKEDFTKVLLKANDKDIILVDMNDADVEELCHDVLYLLEPSTIKLNKLIRKNRKVFQQMAGKKIVLNKSLLDSKDVLDFENEARTQVFYNLPPLNDRTKNSSLDNLLVKIGLIRQKQEEPDLQREKKILGLFKF